MRLLSIKVTNFKKLGTFIADFSAGMTAVVGENAVGKSTLLQAVECALFGVSVVPGKKDHIPTWGQTKWAVELKFTTDRSPECEEYFVLTRTKSTARLESFAIDNVKNPLILANGNSPVTAYIEDHLGLTAKDYNLFVQSKQGMTAGLLTFGAAALSRKLEEFSGADVVDKVQQLANKRATQAQANAAASDVSPEKIDELESELEDSRLAADEALVTLQDAKESLETLTPPAVELPSPSSEELYAQRRESEKVERQRRSAEQECVSAKESLSAIEASPEVAPESPENLEHELAATRKELKDVQRALKTEEALEAEITRSLGRQTDLNVKLAECESSLADLSPLTARVEDLKTALTEATGQRAAAREKLSSLLAMEKDAVCPTCRTRLTEHDPEELAKEISTATSELRHLEDQENTAKDGLKDAEGTLTEARKGHESLRALTESLAEVEEWLESTAYPEDMDSKKVVEAEMSEKVVELTARLSNLQEAQSRYVRYSKTLKAAKTRVEDAEQSLQRLPTAVVAPPSLELIEETAKKETEYAKTLSDHTATKRLLEQAVTNATNDYEQKLVSVGRISKQLSELHERSQRAAKFLVEADTARRLSRFLGERRQLYLSQVWDAILASASRQVAQSSSQTITEVKYRDGEFWFVEDGIEAPATSASGAQKAHLGVALRVGLARALYGNDSLLILDEPTESMSEANATALVASLAASARQVLLITHREQDQALAGNLIALGE